MTKNSYALEQLNREINRLQEQNRTLSVELAFHRRIFKEMKNALGTVAEFEVSSPSSDTIRQLLQENEKLKNEIKMACLSERERQVLRHIAKGYTSKKIADCLNISKLTVDTHRKHIQQKLGVSNMAELIRLSIAVN